MPVPAVFAATCLAAAFGSILMGAFARYPIALAPGMGLNAYFTYTVVKGHGRTVANGAGRGVSVRRGVPDSYRGGRSAMDHRGNPLGTICRGERWDRPVHCLCRTAQRGNCEGGSSDDRLHGKPARSKRRARGVRNPDRSRRCKPGRCARRFCSAFFPLPRSAQWPAWSIGSRNPIDGATFPATMLHLDVRGRSGWDFSKSSSCSCLWIYSTTSAP